MSKPIDFAVAQQRAALRAQLSEAHALMAEVHKRAKVLIARTDSMLAILVDPGGDQGELDRRTRRYHRAVTDLVEAANAYGNKYVKVTESRDASARTNTTEPDNAG